MVRKMNASQASGRQQLSKAAFGLSGLEWRAIKQKFIFGDTQQERPLAAPREALLELIPGDCELSFSSLVTEAVQADILHQYVQTVDERPGGSDPATFVCVRRDDKVAPGNSRDLPRVMRTMRRCTLRR